MSSVLIVSLGILVIGLLFIGSGGYNHEEGVAMFGVVVSVLTLIFGFGLFGGLVPAETERTEIKEYELIKTDNRVIVDSEFGTRTFNSIKYLDITKNDIKISYVRTYNSYGTELESSIKIKEIKGVANE